MKMLEIKYNNIDEECLQQAQQKNKSSREQSK